MRRRFSAAVIAVLATLNLAAYCAAPEDDINPTRPEVTVTDPDAVVEQ